jgi:hypothetical protein
MLCIHIRTLILGAGFEVLVTVPMKITIFSMTSEAVHRRFGKNVSPQFSGSTSFAYRLIIALLIGVFIDPEDGGDKLFRNVVDVIPNYTALQLQKFVLLIFSDPLQWPDHNYCVIIIMAL